MKRIVTIIVLLFALNAGATEPDFNVVGSVASLSRDSRPEIDFRLVDSTNSGPSVVKLTTYENDGVKYMVMPSGQMCPISVPNSYKGWQWDVNDQAWHKKSAPAPVVTVNATVPTITAAPFPAYAPAMNMPMAAPMAMPMMHAAPMMSMPSFGGGGFMRGGGGGGCSGGG